MDNKRQHITKATKDHNVIDLSQSIVTCYEKKLNSMVRQAFEPIPALGHLYRRTAALSALPLLRSSSVWKTEANTIIVLGTFSGH